MQRMKWIVLVVLAVLCISQIAVAVATASEGEIVNKEGNALVKNKFTSTSGVIIVETASGTKVECKKSTGHGIYTSKTGGEQTLLFKECTTSGFACKGGKDAEGEAPAGSVDILAGILIKRSSATTRLALFTIHKPGTSEPGELEVVCMGVKLKFKGSMLTSSNFTTKTLSKNYSVEFQQKKGVQDPDEYENEKGEKVKATNFEMSLEGGAFESCGVEATNSVSFEEEVQFE